MKEIIKTSQVWKQISKSQRKKCLYLNPASLFCYEMAFMKCFTFKIWHRQKRFYWIKCQLVQPCQSVKEYKWNNTAYIIAWGLCTQNMAFTIDIAKSQTNKFITIFSNDYKIIYKVQLEHSMTEKWTKLEHNLKL